MKYAIDRIAIGQEREVDADEFDGMYYIPYRQTRFICPECGEIVYFRRRGGNNPNQFYHQEKNEKTPECDKRVESYSHLSLYQRLGLPLYLTGLSYGDFRLSIGFPALGEVLLKRAAEKNYEVNISGGHEKRKIKLDYNSFIADALTLIPIRFIPTLGSNYNITINGDEEIYGLRRKWAEYADGFEIGGAIFSYDDNGGKKFRRGDSISTYRKYIAITKGTFLQRYREIYCRKIGVIKLGDIDYSISEFEVKVSVDDEYTYKQIDAFLNKYFGVSLLVKQPELLPVWPPFVKKEYLLPTSKRMATCVVSSASEDPRVFTYKDYNSKQIDVLETKSHAKIIRFDVQDSPTIVSVDRKYVGREVVFVRTQLPESRRLYEVKLYNNREEEIAFSQISKESLSKECSVVTNDKIEIYLGLNGEIYKHYSIREKRKRIMLPNSINKLIFLVESYIIANIDLSIADKTEESISDLAEKISRCTNEPKIPIPLWVHGMIRSLYSQNSFELAKAIMTVSKNGFISQNALNILQQYR